MSLFLKEVTSAYLIKNTVNIVKYYVTSCSRKQQQKGSEVQKYAILKHKIFI